VGDWLNAAVEILAQGEWPFACLFLLILAEESGVPLPLPGDVFIAAMGFLARSRETSFAFARTAAVVTVATVLGATALYLLSRHAGRPLLARVARRFGYTEQREARLEAWLARRGAVAVVVGRLIPGLRIVMTVVAGALRLRPGTFVVGTCFAGLIWATLYFWIGYAVGAGYERVAGRPAAELIGPALGIAAALLAAAVLTFRWRRRARAAKAQATPFA
jgi:membrane protein DedA with SNARE-associated domain